MSQGYAWSGGGLGPNLTPKLGIEPSGIVDGINTTFTLPDSPYLGQIAVYLNIGRLRNQDFTLSGSTLTLNDAPHPPSGPETGDVILCDYFVG